MKLSISLLVILLCLSGLQAQNRYDVVINEIMADPSPSVGLPNYEWIELKNRSAAPVNLQNWRIGDASGLSGPMPFFILEPDSLVIICSSTALASMNQFGKSISVTSFPSLDNDGDLVFLIAAGGLNMHAVNYSIDWYRNDLKKQGGWTLEMIDAGIPCTGKENWKASISNTGGSPGKENTIHGILEKAEPPHVEKAYTLDERRVVIVFNEPLDSLLATRPSNYQFENGPGILSVIAHAPLFNEIELLAGTPLSANKVYTIRLLSTTTCQGENIPTNERVRVGLPSDPAKGECIINEILFNPKPNAFDYVELYNNSSAIFDAARLSIANRNGSGIISSIKSLSNKPFYIFPGDYIVLTDDADNLALNYLVKNPGNILPISLPSFPDTNGDVLLLNAQGDITDEVKYSDSWHFQLITNPEGVSLERIDPSGPSNDPTNWHSAASTAGYGTPSYQNSQYKIPGESGMTIEVTPKIFSPDNDGYDDITAIQYKTNEHGYAAIITIYDVAGIPVNHLVRNSVLGLSGYWNWDGLDDKKQKLPIGPYIVLTELFNPGGKKKIFKTVVIIARRIN